MNFTVCITDLIVLTSVSQNENTRKPLTLTSSNCSSVSFFILIVCEPGINVFDICDLITYFV